MTFKCRRCEYECEESRVEACPQCGKPDRLENYVDIVFCIDVSGSMQPCIRDVKNIVARYPRELVERLAGRDVQLDQVRARIITFGNLQGNTGELRASRFFKVGPSEVEEEYTRHLSDISVPRLQRSGEHSGLEALGVALGSDWTHEGDKRRHIVLLFSDSGAHSLESRVGEVPLEFGSHVPASLDELTDIWDCSNSGRLKKSARRLHVFAPDKYPWNIIGDAWGQTVWLPSQAGAGLEELEFDSILSTVVNSW